MRCSLQHSCRWRRHDEGIVPYAGKSGQALKFSFVQQQFSTKTLWKVETQNVERILSLFAVETKLAIHRDFHSRKALRRLNKLRFSTKQILNNNK